MMQRDIKGLRKKKGLTQTQVALKIGVSIRTYRRIENMENRAKRDYMSALWPILNSVTLQDCKLFVLVDFGYRLASNQLTAQELGDEPYLGLQPVLLL